MLESVKHNWKTTLAAVLYATVEALVAMPDFHDMSLEQLGLKALRIALVTLIGLLASDAKNPEEKKPDGNNS